MSRKPARSHASQKADSQTSYQTMALEQDTGAERIRVIIRIRPMNEREKNYSEKKCLENINP